MLPALMLVSTCRVERQFGVGRQFDRDPYLCRGYVLHVTNLEEQPFDYLLNVIMTVASQTLFPRLLTASEVEQFARFTGDAGFYVEQPFRRTGVTYTAGVRFRVSPGATGAVGIMPPAFSGSLCRLEGYVTLRLPPARRATRRFFLQPQAGRPVRVLLNPETRTLFETGGTMDIYDDEPPRPGLGLFPYTVDPPPVQRGLGYLMSRTIERTEPLHVATGKAENEIEPEGSPILSIEKVQYALEALKAGDAEVVDYRGAELVADQDRAGALIELLCELGDDPALTRAINKVLEEQQAAMRIRKP